MSADAKIRRRLARPKQPERDARCLTRASLSLPCEAVLLFETAPEHRRLLLRAMRTACLADGLVRPEELALLEAARDALGDTCDPAALEPLGDLELRALDLEKSEREHLVQAVILMAVIDGEVTESEARCVERMAQALGVDDARVQNLIQLAHGRVLAMKWDLTRRGYARDELLRTARDEGLAGVYAAFGPIVGLGRDPALAQRYIALGALPHGTVGRAYFDFITRNDLGFPGEQGGLGERGVWHDMLHVVGDYPITPRGEAEVVAFMAGFRREDPFFWIFTVALQFQVGLRISPFAPGVPHTIDPRSFVRHHARGARVKMDLSTDWHFRADWARPLDAVRAELGVTPA